MTNKTYAILGGDMRARKTAELLALDGNKVYLCYFEDNENLYNNLMASDMKSAVEQSNVVVLPLPCITKSGVLNAPFWNESVPISEIFAAIPRGAVVVGGKVDASTSRLAESFNINIVDYLEREEFAILNAIATAEGAIQIAIGEMPINIHSANCLVTGFGRVGKVLCKDLQGLSANVHASARKHSDFAWIKAYGYKPLDTNKLTYELDKFDVIFNTVPDLIFTGELLTRLKKDCIVIDLASKPGGVDFNAAQEMGIKVIWALSLPGKVSPYSSGEILKQTIVNIVDS